MHKHAGALVAYCLFFSAALIASQVKGTVTDPSGAPVSGAAVSYVSRVGVEARTLSALNGSFELEITGIPDAHIVITAPGFRTQTLDAAPSLTVHLSIAPQVDSVRVVGSTIDVTASEQGSSVSLIPSAEVRQRNEAYAMDLLRYLPGMTFNQSGGPGGVSTLFLRGGNSNFNLVQIDGIPVNVFGGNFDFAHIPSEAVESVDVIRGPQSAVYGSYANSGVINFTTRQPGSVPELDLMAEGGTFAERRFGITGSATVAGFGVAASFSRYDTNGPVQNGDYHNQDGLVNVTRRFGRHNLTLHADFDFNDDGEPGPYGSDPKDTFSGIDTISRSRNNFGNYGLHYEGDFTSRIREEVLGSFFVDNSNFASPFGSSFNKDLRWQGEERTIVSVSRHYTTAFGFTTGREEVKNTFVSDANFETFPIQRTDLAGYWENRFDIGGRLFLNAGLRYEWIRTPAIPTDGFSRPFFPESTVSRVNPKISAAYVVKPSSTRLHSSFGTGIRPPTGFELAFTNNPQLKPERTRSIDAGIEQKLFGNLLMVDGTYFYNRYYDLIVTLGGTLAKLSSYQSANLANSRAQGAEFSASLRPGRRLFITGSYTVLATRILSLDGSNGLAPNPFQVGQQLTRRPKNSGSVVATYTRGRFTGDVTGYFRGQTLYEEPSFGASNGLFWNPGFANVGFNLNVALAHGLIAYGSLRNALNWHYEEVFGFPSPRLNFVAGLKWKISRGQ
jgi:outer membrane receptor protein involved in Fe transport